MTGDSDERDRPNAVTSVGITERLVGRVLRITSTAGRVTSCLFLTRNPMPALRLNMRKIKDVLRLKFEAGQAHQQIATALQVSKGVVTKYIGLAVAAGLSAICQTP